jgi:hypothetical protein
VDAIETEVMENFDVSDDRVDTTITYSSTSTMVVDSTDLSDEDVIASIESALADELNIHPSDFKVSYDGESGLVTFVITSDDIESVNDAVTKILDESFISNLDFEENLSINSIEVSDDIVVTVDVVVDASNVADASVAMDAVTSSISSQDRNYEIQQLMGLKYQ